MHGVKSAVMEEKREFQSQQKIASQLPRGTRLDATGTRLEVKGSRNYTSLPLFITPDEMFEDIFIRGLRADGLSSKLGVKNNRDVIAKLISSLFQKDPRQESVMVHFNSKRQRSNCAKTIFSTMTQEELRLIKSELLPTKVDSEVRNHLGDTYFQQPQKLQNSIEVLRQLQETFNRIEPQTELLSLHNFQTRGFFTDVLTMMSSFLIQIIEDVLAFSTPEVYQATKGLQDDIKEKEDKTAAEILLSVGSDVRPITTESIDKLHLLKNPAKTIAAKRHDPIEITSSTTIEMKSCQENAKEVSLPDSNKDWATFEMVDSQGQSKYVLLKTPKDSYGAIDTEKLLQILNCQEEFIIESGSCEQNVEFSTTPKVGKSPQEVQSQQSDLNMQFSNFSNNKDDNYALATSQPYLLPTLTDNSQVTTLEIALNDSPPPEGDVSTLKRQNEENQVDLANPKRHKT